MNSVKKTIAVQDAENDWGKGTKT